MTTSNYQDTINSILQTATPNKRYQIVTGEYPAYAIKHDKEVSVSIPFDEGTPIEESFNIVAIKRFEYYIGDKRHVDLSLTAPETCDLKQFSFFAASFVDPSNRKKLLEDPFSWVDEWKDLLGDTVKKHKVYDVLGELIALREVLKVDKDAKWVGPEGGTHDIVGPITLYEVKTTNTKNNYNIKVNSAFQISETKPEYLIFCHLECKPFANSINSLVKELVSMGYSEASLEKNLKSKGYPVGSRKRDATYEILEIGTYRVNKHDFPMFSLEALNKLTGLSNIVNFDYVLDLKTAPQVKLGSEIIE